MKNKENFALELRDRILDIIAVAKKYGVEDDFSYMFCYGILSEGQFGHSWSVMDIDELESLCGIASAAYEIEDEKNNESPFFEDGMGLN